MTEPADLKIRSPITEVYGCNQRSWRCRSVLQLCHWFFDYDNDGAYLFVSGYAFAASTTFLT